MDNKTFFSKSPNWRYSGLVLGLSAAILSLILSLLGFSSFLDDYIYNHILRLSISLQNQPVQVHLIKDDSPQVRTENDFIQLLDGLEKFAPRRIVFNFTPHFDNSLFYEKAEKLGNVVFGRQIAQMRNDSGDLEMESVPEQAGKVPFGIVHTPPWEDGVFRKEFSRFEVGGEVYPALEIACLDSTQPFTQKMMQQDTYLVNFLGGANTLPSSTFDQVIQNKLSQDMIEGKTVFIYQSDNRVTLRLPTPTTHGGSLMTLAEYQGQAINCLLSGTPIVMSKIWLSILILLVIMLICSLVYQTLEANAILVFTGVTILIYAVAAFVSLYVLHSWIAVNEIIVGQIILFFLIKNRKLDLVGQSLNTITLSLSARAQRYFDPGNFYSDPNCWPYILKVINQTLNLDRCILLERTAKQKHLKEIISYQCNIDDIGERRRDFQRTPYSTAIEKRGAVKVDDYLANAKPNEEQYVFPFLFGGELYGFGAVAVDKEKIEDLKKFESILDSYGEQIGQLLYNYRLINSSRETPSYLSQLISYEQFQTILQNVRKLTAFIHDRSLKLSHAHDNLHTSFIIYDLFGRLYLINKSMRTIMEELQIDVENLSALDLITAITKLDLGETRKMFQTVLLERQDISVSVPGPNQHKYWIILHPMILDDATLTPDASMFDIWGICLELIDMTNLENSAGMNENPSIDTEPQS